MVDMSVYYVVSDVSAFGEKDRFLICVKNYDPRLPYLSQAYEVFQRIHGLDPRRVSCDCCGPDFSFLDCDTRQEAYQYVKETSHYRPNGRVFDENGFEISLDDPAFME